MRQARAAWLLIASVLAGCSGEPAKPREPAEPKGPRAARADESPRPSPELAPAVARHLELLHRLRLSRELARDGLGALAGPAPSPGDLDASTRQLRSLGLAGDDDTFSSADTFARLAQPAVSDAGLLFLGWTPELDDVGLAKVRGRRPGQFRLLWTAALEYEVILLDGFLVLDYPRFREAALEHKEAARVNPRKRGALIIIDAKGLAEDARRAVAEKKTGAAALEHVSEDELAKEIELREAGYLRFQDEAPSAAALDQAVTWVEILEGNPDLALAGGVVSSGDGPDELRRVGAVQAIVGQLAAADAKEERSEVLSLPLEERRKKLKELAPAYIRSALGH